MPYITDNEYKKFKELLEEKKRRDDLDKMKDKVFLQNLIERTKLTLLDLSSHYGPVEVYAVQFVKLIKKMFKEEKTDVYWMLWREFTEYVTDVCLMKKRGRIFLKKSFRERLRDYGIYTHIMRKRGVIKIWLDEPVKRTKK